MSLGRHFDSSITPPTCISALITALKYEPAFKTTSTVVTIFFN